MYRCEVCRSVAGSGTPKLKIVVETRPRDYPPRPKVHFVPGRAGGQGKWVDDPGGHGNEIVREVTACPACSAKARAIERGAMASMTPT